MINGIIKIPYWFVPIWSVFNLQSTLSSILIPKPIPIPIPITGDPTGLDSGSLKDISKQELILILSSLRILPYHFSSNRLINLKKYTKKWYKTVTCKQKQGYNVWFSKLS